MLAVQNKSKDTKRVYGKFMLQMDLSIILGNLESLRNAKDNNERLEILKKMGMQKA